MSKRILRKVKGLAIEYYQLTGKPLGIIGEIAEYVAAQEERKEPEKTTAGEGSRKGDCVMPTCFHADEVREVIPSARGCEECLKSGSVWVHLRLCRTCG